MYRYSITLLLTTILLVSCEEVIELDTDQTPPQYVIDGLVTDEFAEHYVRITTTTDFYDTGTTPGVSGAAVMVSSDRGTAYTFAESETEAGLYTASFAGEVGSTYTLQATLSTGEVFAATDTMAAVPPIDSLTWTVNEDEREDPSDSGFFYDVLIYLAEPQETEDYYLFNFYRNDSIQRFDSETGLFYSDDELLGDYVFGLDFPLFFRAGDTATLEMYTTSRSAFLFYTDLDNVLNGDGGMLSPSPTNPRTNVIGDGANGFGLFRVSAVQRKTVVVGE